MVDVVPNGGYKVVASEGKFKIKILDIGGSTKGFAPEVFDNEADAKAFIANGNIEVPVPEVKPEFVPDSNVVPAAPEVAAAPETVSAPEAPVAPENIAPTEPEVPVAPAADAPVIPQE